MNIKGVVFNKLIGVIHDDILCLVMQDRQSVFEISTGLY